MQRMHTDRPTKAHGSACIRPICSSPWYSPDPVHTALAICLTNRERPAPRPATGLDSVALLGRGTTGKQLMLMAVERCSLTRPGPRVPRCRKAVSQGFRATSSISTRAPSGRPATATVVRAG